MKRYIPLVLDTIAVIALAVWLGGLAVCWLALAPVVQSTSANAMPGAQILFAETLRRFSSNAELCGVVLAALQWVLRRRYQNDRPLYIADGARMLAMFVALFAAEYGRYVLIPTLIKTHSPAAFNALAGFAVVQAILLVGFAAVSLWLLSPGVAFGKPTPVRPAAVPVRPATAPAKPTVRPTSKRRQ